jgi:acetyl/propionyl-CoA carboxylase alpha subunit/acetyl-CoA carboxylase carboxyltransferase component
VTEIHRLAVVNRGEPAMRALNAVAELNDQFPDRRIQTIAVYTDPDATAWFVRAADEAVSLGPATVADPAGGRRISAYLDEERVLAALRAARADAVWVGWGFVAEHASFAQRCEEAGIVFVGPDSATIRLLGDKVAAKRLAERAGVAVVPWSGRPVTDAADAATHAHRLGYPVVLKASAGGGGRGIRLVREQGDLAAALESARSEAMLAFGDPAVFLEAFVSAARHVEVQVVADQHGTTWAAGVRDCSIQRRNQKVIEESASTVLDAESEQAIRAAAVRLVSAASYRNAGTVEFLVDPATGAVMFMEVNTRLQVEHPVTELTTGLDLVKLQLHVACGGRLDPAPPPVRGHAVEARLCAEDPESGFRPAPGRIVLLRPPAGPGIRVDGGIAEGDVVAADFDSMIAKVVAWGRDREEAIARLRRALAQSVVVVEGGTTNRSFLLSLLGREEVRTGQFDNRWLDRITAAGGHLPAPDPVALLQAAVHAYDADQRATEVAFHAAAARGRPEMPEQAGHRVRLRYRGRAYQLGVHRTGPDSYQVDVDGPAGGRLVDLRVDRWSDHEFRLTVAGRAYRTVTAAQGATVLVDVDGVSHRVGRDDGGVVRAAGPAFVLRVPVALGDRVAEGDPVAVLESMKMETTVLAPFAGTVADIAVAANSQVEAGAPLLRIREDEPEDGSDRAGPVARSDLPAVDFSAFVTAATPSGGCAPVYAVLRRYLLGYDLPPEAARQVLADHRRLTEDPAAVSPQLLRCEDELLDLFADVAGLYRPQPEPDRLELEGGSAQEYLLSYLQWLDPDRAGLPESFRRRLTTALARYGLGDLRRTPELESAVVWMFRSFRRAAEVAPAVAAILQRRLREPAAAGGTADGDLRGRLDRLARSTRGRYQLVADLAADLTFRQLDEPELQRRVADVYARMDRHLAALAADPARSDREDLVEQLVRCPQPLRPALLRWWRAAAEQPPGRPDLREVLLETHVRRFYRYCQLGPIRFHRPSRHPLGAAELRLGEEDLHLVVGYAPLPDLPELAADVATAMADTGPPVVVDIVTWRDGDVPGNDAMAAELAERVAGCEFGRTLHRLDITVTSLAGSPAEHARTQHITFRPGPDGGFVEDPLYRNLHPMLAERIELWRLANFALERLLSPEDIFLFRGVAHSNPKDVRLFAMAEVRDLTPARDSAGEIVGYPALERVGLQALAAMRDALAGLPGRDRPQANRVVLNVRPPWEVPRRLWSVLARRWAPLAAGVGLQKAVLRVRLDEPHPHTSAGGRLRDVVLHVEGLGEEGGVAVRVSPPGNPLIQPLSDYRQRVLRARRIGVPYPYELITMLAPPPGSAAELPPGRFLEHDLGEAGGLVPVQRPYGQNTANLVVGLATNQTEKVPEGMTRVLIAGDPTRGLGALAEPECRRIIAALDLAEAERLPVEWFALSSGARIAMDSGTENMDWIGAVLRRIIEFTQAGGEINVVVTGINVGAQPYWNAEATMLMHTRGILVMTPQSAMVLTGKQALDFSGGVSAEDNVGIGGFERVMGPNGQGQYWAPTLSAACQILLRHYEHTYVVPGERFPRRARTDDPIDRDVRTAPHAAVGGGSAGTVGDVFSAVHNPERKKPFDIRSVMRAVVDADSRPLERWARWRAAESAVVWDAYIGGIPVCLLGLESRTLARRGFLPADGPPAWTSGTLFPQSSRKLARALNAASGNRPVVMLANLSGFDGSPESMRRWQLEYGAEIGRAVTNFRGPIVFVVISRYHGGAFVVFSKRLNDQLEIAAVEGSFASVIGGAPAAAVVFVREVKARTERDPRLVALRDRMAVAGEGDAAALRATYEQAHQAVRAEKLGEVAAEFDGIHTIQRALQVGSVDRIIAAAELRPFIVDALERGMARSADTGAGQSGRCNQLWTGSAPVSAAGPSTETGGGAGAS